MSLSGPSRTIVVEPVRRPEVVPQPERAPRRPAPAAPEPERVPAAPRERAGAGA